MTVTRGKRINGNDARVVTPPDERISLAYRQYKQLAA